MIATDDRQEHQPPTYHRKSKKPQKTLRLLGEDIKKLIILETETGKEETLPQNVVFNLSTHLP